jgi:hypothetical protein
MTAKKVAPARIDYPKHWFLMGTLVWCVSTIMLVYLAWASVEVSFRIFWIAATVFEGVVLGYLFVLPLFTHHMAGAKGLRLRMGVLVNETIPYEWIRDVRGTAVRWGGVRVGIGVRYSPIMKVLFVTSSFRDLVSVKLDKEHRLGSPFKRPVGEIVLSVSSAGSFIDMMRQRSGLQKD